MARFTLPRDLYHGKGALDALKDLKGKRAIVVDRKSTRLNSSHEIPSRMPSSA